MSTNAVVGGHYGSPLDGSQPSQPPPGLVVSGPPVVDHTTGTAGTITSRHDINEILQQIMNITDQSLDEAQARYVCKNFSILFFMLIWGRVMKVDQTIITRLFIDEYEKLFFPLFHIANWLTKKSHTTSRIQMFGQFVHFSVCVSFTHLIQFVFPSPILYGCGCRFLFS